MMLRIVYRHLVPHYIVLVALLSMMPPSAAAAAEASLEGLAPLLDTSATAAALALVEGLGDVPPLLDAHLTLQRARLLASRDRRAEAIGLLRRLTLDAPMAAPAQTAARVLLARLLAEAGRWEEARPLLRSILSAYPTHRFRYELRLLLGRSLLETDAAVEGVDELLGLAESVLQKEPARQAFELLTRKQGAGTIPADVPAAWSFRWCRLLSRKRKAAAALDVIHPYITPGPKSRWEGLTVEERAEALTVAGELELRRGNGWWARRLFLRAAALDVGDETKARATVLAGDAMRAVNLDDRALGHYRQVLQRHGETSQGPAALFQMARLAQKDKNTVLARSLFRQLASRYPTSWFTREVHWSMGRAQYAAKEWLDAARSFAAFCEAAPDDRLVTTARYWQAKALSHAGDASGARTALEAVFLRQVPGLYHLAAAYYLDRGTTSPRGLPFPRFEGWLSHLPKLLDKVPARPADGWTPLTRVLGPDDLARVDLLRRLGLTELLVDELERLVLASPSSGPLRLDLAWAYLQRGDYPAAQEQAEIVVGRPRPFEDVDRAQLFDKLYPVPRMPAFTAACTEFGVPLRLALSVAREESRFATDLESWSGARGVMQVMPATGRWIASALALPRWSDSRLYDAATNIRLGVWYLDHLAKKFSGVHDARLLVMASYNGGPGNVGRWLDAADGGSFDEFLEGWHLDETRNYVKKVSRSLICYELLDGRRDR